MKVLKTIVATAVIVFALTTVAMAGVQRLGGQDPATSHAGPAAARQTAVQPAAQGNVTLSSQQFAALLRAVRHDADGARDRHTARAHEKARKHSQASRRSGGTSGNTDGAGGASTTAHHTQTHTGTTHHSTTHQTTTHTGSHDGGSDDGHDGDHGGGEGGCD